MSEVTRYEYDGAVMLPFSGGAWVRAADYDALTVELERALASIRRINAGHREAIDRMYDMDVLLRRVRVRFKTIPADMSARIDAALAGQQQQGEPCDTCDGSGDVHRADGEWLGECPHCKTDRPAAADEQQAFEAGWAIISAVLPSHQRRGYSAGDIEEAEKEAGWATWQKLRAAPAPAAVVMPERMTTIPEGKTISYAAGYEAALDAVANLNRRTLSLELLEQAIRCLDEKLNKHETHATKYATADQLRAILEGPIDD